MRYSRMITKVMSNEDRVGWMDVARNGWMDGWMDWVGMDLLGDGIGLKYRLSWHMPQ